MGFRGALALGLLAAFATAQSVSWADCCCGSLCEHKNECAGCGPADGCPGGGKAGCCDEAPTPHRTCSHAEPSSEIVVVAAEAAPAPVAHATSKSAVVRLAQILADELRPQHIRVNAVLPSVIDTPANRTWMSADLAARAVAPSAIAKVIAFLCGPDAAPISGAAIPVYGDA